MTILTFLSDFQRLKEIVQVEKHVNIDIVSYFYIHREVPVLGFQDCWDKREKMERG